MVAHSGTDLPLAFSAGMRQSTGAVKTPPLMESE